MVGMGPPIPSYQGIIVYHSERMLKKTALLKVRKAVSILHWLKGSPVQGELSAARLTEGLTVAGGIQSLRHGLRRATSLYTREALSLAKI